MSSPVATILALDDPKAERLVAILRELDRVAVAYSGGVDSAFLLKAAHDVLGDRATGVLATSESLDRSELEGARRVAVELGIPIRIIETREYDNPDYRRNSPDRCYHCKSELFAKVVELARAEGIPHVADGSNLDDQGDYRPGLRARSEKGVRSSLAEAGLAKADIRRLSRLLGVPTWDKPSAPCLSSRIPYGSEVTEAKLRAVEAAEGALRDLGFREVRVRHHDQVARIEIPTAQIARFLEESVRSQAVARVKAAGFLYVTLDIQGLRSGSMNEALKPRAAAAPMVKPESIERL
jgi:uncharacterized protein